MQNPLAAKVISYLFHPLMLPTLGLFLFFRMPGIQLYYSNDGLQLFLYSATLLATFFFPLLCALLLLRMGLIHSLEMHTKEERKLPYLCAAIFYFLESYFLIRVEMPDIILKMMMGATVLVLLTLIVNMFWKISAHMTGIGGLLGIFLAISYRLQVSIHWMLIMLVLAAGLIAYSRLRLNAHSSSQVYAGFFLGVTAQFLFVLLVDYRF